MLNKNSLDYYGLWEEINNEAPYNHFIMTFNRWKRDFNAIGIILNSGKCRGN